MRASLRDDVCNATRPPNCHELDVSCRSHCLKHCCFQAEDQRAGSLIPSSVIGSRRVHKRWEVVRPPQLLGVPRASGCEEARQRASRCGRQTGDAVARAERLLYETGAQRAGQPDAEHHGEAADLVLKCNPLADQLLARDDERPDGMRWQGLHMYCFEEARAGEVRQITRIVAIGFVGRKRLQRLIGLPGLDADDEQPKLGQTVIEHRSNPARLEQDAPTRRSLRKRRLDIVWRGRDLGDAVCDHHGLD